jgi:hypothetical protein
MKHILSAPLPQQAKETLLVTAIMALIVTLCCLF